MIGLLKKQLKYAAELNVNFVFISGADERSKAVWTVRNMRNGEQIQFPLEEAVSFVSSELNF